jgi:hypothetical protein
MNCDVACREIVVMNDNVFGLSRRSRADLGTAM